MENNTIYGIPITQPVQGETAVYRHPKHTKALMQTISPEIITMQDIIKAGMKKWRNNELFGTKKPNSHKEEFKTWSEMYDLASSLGCGILHEGLVSPIKEEQDYQMNFIAIYSKNREEWVTCDWACVLFGFVSVPFYDSLGVSSIKYIINQTHLQTIACSWECLERLLKENDLGTVKNFICFDLIDPTTIAKELSSKKERFYEMGDLIELGRKNLREINNNVTKNDIFTLAYTSGTCGLPKGAVLSNENMVAGLGAENGLNYTLAPTDRFLSELPLAHLEERLIIWCGLFFGIKIGFYCGNIQKISEDMNDLKPTVFLGVPRLFNKMYDLLTNSFKKLPCVKKWLVEKGLQSKLQRLQSKRSVRHFVWDNLVFKSIQARFGGCINVFFSASAPLSNEVKDFLKVVFSVQFVEGEGLTESTGGALSTFEGDWECEHIGGPLPIAEIKLVDVPEMNFSTSHLDKNGKMVPQGEICIRGPGIFKGEEKEEDKTKEALDKDGWLHSGDIGEQETKGNEKIIDRKKNIFKLSQGEYVAPEKLEIIYQRSRAIEDAFIYGDSLQSELVGIFVPKRFFIEEKAKEFGLEKQEFSALLENEKIKEAVKKELDATANKEKLVGFEKVSRLKLVSDSFQSLGILTTTFKLKRYDAKLYFKNSIDELYKLGPIEEKRI